MDSEKLPSRPSNPFDGIPPNVDILSFELLPSSELLKKGEKLSVNARCSMTDGTAVDWMVVRLFVGDDEVVSPTTNWKFCRDFEAIEPGTTSITASLEDRFGNVREASATVRVST